MVKVRTALSNPFKSWLRCDRQERCQQEPSHQQSGYKELWTAIEDLDRLRYGPESHRDSRREAASGHQNLRHTPTTRDG